MSIAWVFILTCALTLGWGFYFGAAVYEYVQMRSYPVRLRSATIRGFRRVVVAFCLFAFHAAFFVRTGLVLAGFGESTAGLLVFYSLIGVDVTGVLFCLTSLWYD